MDQWDAIVDGKKYNFTYEHLGNRHIVTANGFPIEVKRHFLSCLLGFDEKFTFDGNEGRLLIRRKMTGNVQTPGIIVEPEIVFNGILLQSGTKYVKRIYLVIMLALMCLFIPLVILGGSYFLLGYVFMIFVAIPLRPSSFDSIKFAVFLAAIVCVIGILMLFSSGN